MYFCLRAREKEVYDFFLLHGKTKRERKAYVKSEMSKVAWPSKKDMVKYTIASLVFIIFFALFFYGIEVLMAWLKSIIVVI